MKHKNGLDSTRILQIDYTMYSIINNKYNHADLDHHTYRVLICVRGKAAVTAAKATIAASKATIAAIATSTAASSTTEAAIATSTAASSTTEAAIATSSASKATIAAIATNLTMHGIHFPPLCNTKKSNSLWRVMATVSELPNRSMQKYSFLACVASSGQISTFTEQLLQDN